MAALPSISVPHRWHTPFTPERSSALDRVIIALEGMQAAAACPALRRLKAILEPVPGRKAVQP